MGDVNTANGLDKQPKTFRKAWQALGCRVKSRTYVNFIQICLGHLINDEGSVGLFAAAHRCVQPGGGEGEGKRGSVEHGAALPRRRASVSSLACTRQTAISEGCLTPKVMRLAYRLT